MPAKPKGDSIEDSEGEVLQTPEDADPGPQLRMCMVENVSISFRRGQLRENSALDEHIPGNNPHITCQDRHLNLEQS